MRRNEARTLAIAEGRKTYKVEKPCKTCGGLDRYCSNHSCSTCLIVKGLQKLANSELMEPYRTQEKTLKRLQNWRETNPSRYKSQWLSRYGICHEDFVTMLNEQNGVCAICRQPEPTGRNLAVDHCHDTGKVRGLLCFGCNTALGRLNTEDLLMKAVEYLRQNNG